MRKLVVALLALVLAGTMLAFTAPADAAGRTWHTVLKNRRAAYQACKQPGEFDTYRKQMTYTVYWRVNNRLGRKSTTMNESGYDGGEWVQSGQFPRIRPHQVTKAASHYPEYDSEVVNISSRYGHHRKTGSVTLAMIGLC